MNNVSKQSNIQPKCIRKQEEKSNWVNQISIFELYSSPKNILEHGINTIL